MISSRGLIKSRRLLLCAAMFGAAAVAGAAILLTMQPKVQAAEPLSAYAPQGSLMAVESPDFAGEIAAWTNSPEEKAWVKSDSYAEFSHSRLFSRLSEAQSEFAASAGLAPNTQFLSWVAGRESLFAWYDIGRLEFLYVTRMKPGEAANNPLMKLADKFQMRKAGADSFYIRAEAKQGDADLGMDQGTARTVAFAVHGDVLLLATREDLIANALLLAQHQGDSTLRNEPWYAAAVSSVEASKSAAQPDLRMTLNLARIVPSPYFRSYWVKRNVTEMKQYSAAVSDLYRSKDTFREERVLIPKSPDAVAASGDLGPILKYLPADSGVYRATAGPGTAEIVDQLNQRLIARGVGAYRDPHVAPVADLSDASAGSNGDLDTRIDEEPVPELPMAKALDGLRRTVGAARPGAMLVYSTTNATVPEGQSMFVPIHSAVVLSSAAAWDPATVQGALVEALRVRLTVGGVGLSWQARQQEGESWMQLSGLQPLSIAVRGADLIVASDPETLLQMLGSARRETRTAREYANARTVAGFNSSAERAGLLRLSAMLDRNHAGPDSGSSGSVTASPAFFSGEMGGLSDTFKALDSETFVERPTENHALRQVVVYRWKP